MEQKDTMKLLPSGIYKTYLINRLFLTYNFKNPILEIGCGTGEFIETMKRYNLSGEMLDMNEKTIDICRTKCIALSVDMKIHNINFFDYRSNTQFNTIFMFEILEHIDNDQAALAKIYDLLNKNGLFLMSVPAKQSLYSDEDMFQGHFRRYEKSNLEKQLQRAGFHIEIFWCYNPLPYITHLFMRKRKEYNDNIERRTKESSHVLYPTKKKLIKIFYPIYSRMQFLLKFQNLFLNTDFGAHYLVLCKK